MTYEEMMEQALEMLKTNDDLLVEIVNEMDSWNGYADGYRAFPMYELDELFCDCKVSEFLDKLAPDFDLHDEYMIDTIYGLSSTSDIVTLYRDNVDEGCLLDDVIDNWPHIYCTDTEFSELIDSIINYTEEDEEETEDIRERVASVIGTISETVQNSIPEKEKEGVTA